MRSKEIPENGRKVDVHFPRLIALLLLFTGLLSYRHSLAEHAPLSQPNRVEGRPLAPGNFSSDAIKCRAVLDLFKAHGLPLNVGKNGSYLVPAIREQKKGFYTVQHADISFFEVPAEGGFLSLEIPREPKIYTRLQFDKGHVWPNASIAEIYEGGHEPTSVKNQLSRGEIPSLLVRKIKTDDERALLAIREDMEKRLRSIPTVVSNLVDDSKSEGAQMEVHREIAKTTLAKLGWPDDAIRKLESCLSQALGVQIAKAVQDELRLLAKETRREIPFNTLFDTNRRKLLESNPGTPRKPLKH